MCTLLYKFWTCFFVNFNDYQLQPIMHICTLNRFEFYTWLIYNQSLKEHNIIDNEWLTQYYIDWLLWWTTVHDHWGLVGITDCLSLLLELHCQSIGYMSSSHTLTSACQRRTITQEIIFGLWLGSIYIYIYIYLHQEKGKWKHLFKCRCPVHNIKIFEIITCLEQRVLVSSLVPCNF